MSTFAPRQLMERCSLWT